MTINTMMFADENEAYETLRRQDQIANQSTCGECGSEKHGVQDCPDFMLDDKGLPLPICQD